MKILLAIIMILSLASCTENQRAKQYGGTQSINIQSNERFITSTWKGNNLWIIVENTTTHRFHMKEYSDYGILEGEIIIENKK